MQQPPLLQGAVANPAGCRRAPPGGGAPGQPRERGEGSQPRAGRPTRVELERGKLPDCRYQPSCRRSVVVKQGVRTTEESRKGKEAWERAPYGSRGAFQELLPSRKSFAGSSCWRATAWRREQVPAEASCSRPGRSGSGGCPESVPLSVLPKHPRGMRLWWLLLALPLLSSFSPLPLFLPPSLPFFFFF